MINVLLGFFSMLPYRFRTCWILEISDKKHQIREKWKYMYYKKRWKYEKCVMKIVYTCDLRFAVCDLLPNENILYICLNSLSFKHALRIFFNLYSIFVFSQIGYSNTNAVTTQILSKHRKPIRTLYWRRKIDKIVRIWRLNASGGTNVQIHKTSKNIVRSKSKE